MKSISLVCPRCGAPLIINRKNRTLFCEYCGYKALYEDENDRKEPSPSPDRKSTASSSRRTGSSFSSSGRGLSNIRNRKGCLAGCLSVIIIFIVFAIIGSIASSTSSRSRSYEYYNDNSSAEIIDPFSHVDVRFKGLDGEGQVVFDIDDEGEDMGLYFYSDDNYSLNEGEVITVVAAESYGYKFTQSEKKYTVSGLDYYMNDLSELSEEAAADINSGAQMEIEEYFQGKSAIFTDEKVSLSDPEPAGMYLLSAIDESDWPRNMLYVIFTVTAAEGSKETVIYIPVQYSQIVIKSGGQVKIDYNYGNVYGDYLWSNDLGFSSSDFFIGYTSEKSMYFDIIKSNSSEYVGTVSGGLSEF